MPSPDEVIRTADEFVDLVEALFGHAKSYDPTADPNTLVLDFLRHEEYDDYQWKALIGGVDNGFVEHAQDAGLRLFGHFRDPVFGIGLKPSHFAATAAGVLFAGIPAGSGIDRGDICGWGGDWITFFGDWRRESGQYPDPRDFCRAKLASIDADSTFMLSDLVEDADGFTVAAAVRGGDSIVDALRATYRDGRRVPRIRPFFERRFGTAGTAAASAKDILTPGPDVLVDLGRVYLIETIGGFPTLQPEMLPDEQIEALCQGFAEVLADRMADERTLLEEPAVPGVLETPAS